MDRWTACHFSQTNPQGADQADVAALLRRVAQTIEELGDVDILDIVFHNTVDNGEEWPSMTVYYDDEDANKVAARIVRTATEGE